MSLAPLGAYEKYTGTLPRYVRIAETLRKRLLDYRQRDGARLPSEPTLAREFGVSRETVREALGVLRSEGLVYARTGRGTFVSPWPQQVGLRITQPINEPTFAGRPNSPKVLERAVHPGVLRGERCARHPRPAGRFSVTPSSGRSASRPSGSDGCTCPRRWPNGPILRALRGSRYPTRSSARRGPPDPSASERGGDGRALRYSEDPGRGRRAPVLVFRRVYYQESGRPAEFAIDYQDPQQFPYEEVFVRKAASAAA